VDSWSLEWICNAEEIGAKLVTAQKAGKGGTRVPPNIIHWALHDHADRALPRDGRLNPVIAVPIVLSSCSFPGDLCPAENKAQPSPKSFGLSAAVSWSLRVLSEPKGAKLLRRFRFVTCSGSLNCGKSKA
jgi:hypothetical protein